MKTLQSCIGHIVSAARCALAIERLLAVSVSTVLILCASSLCAQTQNKHISIGDTGDAITEFVNTAHGRLGFTGTVLAANNSKVVASVAVGSREFSKPSLMQTSTIFEIASVTQSITAIAVFRLIEQGKLNLDDSIADHLPDVPDDCRLITIRHLLQHTSGIPGTNTNGRGEDLAMVLPSFLKGGPKHLPGTRREHWNQGYSLVSEVIARASGQPYVEFCRDEIFVPCQMNASCFTGDDPPDGVSVATGTSLRGPARSALDHPYGEYGFQYRGMGGVVTNVWDLWRLNRALTDGSLLSRKSVNEMTTQLVDGYGLGWRVGTTKGGQPCHRSSGSVRGFLSSFRRYPSTNGCLIVLANSDSTIPFQQVVTGCEQLLFGEELKVDWPRQLNPELLAQLTGSFQDEQKRILSVTTEGRFATALIVWDRVRRTYGYLSGKDASSLQFIYGGNPGLPVDVETGNDGMITGLSMLKMNFKRVDSR